MEARVVLSLILPMVRLLIHQPRIPIRLRQSRVSVLLRLEPVEQQEPFRVYLPAPTI